MDSKDRPKFVTMIAAMTSTFGKKADEATLAGYWMGLSDLRLDAVKAAIMLAMREEKFLPTVACIRERCATKAPLSVRAENGWVRRGTDGDPVALRVVRLMGGLGDTPTEEYDHIGRARVKARFIELYKDTAEKMERDEQWERLGGPDGPSELPVLDRKMLSAGEREDDE